MLSALCSKFNELMDTFVPDIGPFIFHALKEKEHSDTIKNACGLISDLCTMVESKNIVSAFEEYVPYLHDILVTKSLQKEAKLGAVTAIGDTYLMTKDRFLPFLDKTLKLFQSAANQTVDVNVNDPDLVEYIVKLQGALIESYTCIIQEINGPQDPAYAQLEPYVTDIIKFCIISVHDNFEPKMGRIKEVAGLIGDLATTYANKEYFQQPEIEQIVNFLKTSDDQEANNIADWVIHVISEVMKR